MSKIKTFIIELLRNGHIESTHQVEMTTNKSEGQKFFPRSAIKPFQIIPLIKLANESYTYLTKEEIAIFGSSHSGQDIHTDLLQNICKKYEIRWEEIYCAPQRPMHINTADRYLENKKTFTKLNNNCSGKHISMLLFSKLLKVDNKNYQENNHIVQEQINKFFMEIFELPKLEFAIDGCGLPALFIDSSIFINGVENINNSEYKDYWLSVFESYNSFPNLVGGENRTDTNIMLNSKSPLLAKSGAEGVLFVTNNDETFVFKCLDGNFRAVDLVATKVLNELGFITEKPYELLNNNYSKNLQNTKVYNFKIK